MASALDRRLQKLEAAANIGDGDGLVRVVLVRVGQDRDEEVAKLGPRRPGERLLTVTFVRAADLQSPGTLQ